MTGSFGVRHDSQRCQTRRERKERQRGGGGGGRGGKITSHQRKQTTKNIAGIFSRVLAAICECSYIAGAWLPGV